MESGGSDIENDVIEQVPHYSLATLDDGFCEKLQLIVELPGVETSAGLIVDIGGSRAFVHLPGRYRLDLPLGVTVADKATKLRYVKNRQYLKAEYEVLERATAAPRAAPERFRPTQTPSPPEIHRHSSSGAAFSPAAPFMAHNGLHDSFIADAVKLRDGWRPGAQGVKSQGAAAPATKQGASDKAAHASARGAASECEEPKLNGHGTPRVNGNGLQRGFLNRASSDSGSGKTIAPAASSGDDGQRAAKEDSLADSSGASEGDQCESPTIHVAASANSQEDETPAAKMSPVQRRERDKQLYEAAKALSNKEAAAECASKAEEALAAADFDKAERLYQKAERLASGEYAHKATAVERRRLLHEAELAAKKREEQEAAKRKKREEEKRRREEAKRQREEESRQKEAQQKEQKMEEEQRRRAEAEATRKAEAKAEAEAEAEATRQREQRRSSSSGNAQEQGSWRSRPHFTGPEYSWGYFDGAGKIMNALISLGYISLCYLLGFFYFLTGERPYQMLAKGRYGSKVQRTAAAVFVMAFWATAFYTAFTQGRTVLHGVWWFWCLIFWRPPLWVAIFEMSIFGLLRHWANVPLTGIAMMPLMWHFVGGGFSAVHGILAYIVYLCNLPVEDHVLLYDIGLPAVYAAVMMFIPWWLRLLLFILLDAFIAVMFWSFRRMKGEPGEAAVHGSASCRPEAVPSGAVPDVARVLQAASWYAVLEVGPSATVEEIRRAHKVKSLVTHPDKLGGRNHGAHEASIRVNTARDVLADPHKRAAYDAELCAAAAAAAGPPPSPRENGGASSSHGSGGMFTEFTGRREPCRRTVQHASSCVCMPCKACAKWHHVYVTDRLRSQSYFCMHCSRYHAAGNRQVWKEFRYRNFFGRRETKVYLHLLGLTLDITDISQGCEVWSFLEAEAGLPDCRRVRLCGGELPIREDCFTAYMRQYQQEAAAAPDTRRSGKKKAGRRRR